MRKLSVHKRRIYRRLSPDTNSPVDCLCLAKGRASGPARPARRVPVGFAVMCHRQQYPSALTRQFAIRRLAPLARPLPSDDPSRFRPCLRLLVILAHDESKAVLPQGTSLHKFTPMLGAHHPLNRNYCGVPAFGLQKSSPNTNLPQWAGKLKRQAAQDQ